MSIGERIKKLRSENGYTQTEFATKLNLSQSVLSLIESDRSSLTIDTIRKISELFNINSHWLIYGKPSFLKDLNTESFIPLVHKPHLDTYMEDRQKNEQEQRLPFFSVPGFSGADFKIFEVQGSSMEPTLTSGDLMICKRERFQYPFRDGSVYFCVTKNEMLLRRLYFSDEGKTVILQSDNRSFSQISLSSDQIEEAWRVVSKISGSFNDDLYMQTLRLEKMEEEVAEVRKLLNEVDDTERGPRIR